MLINTCRGKVKFKNHPFVNICAIINSGEDYQEMLKPLSEKVENKILSPPQSVTAQIC